MQPDIAFLADPNTGVEVIESTFDANGIPQANNQTITVAGGTSLATPMFSALWALANQANGKPLGCAAPYLYRMSKEAITDVLPFTQSGGNVSGSITDSDPNTNGQAQPINYLSVSNSGNSGPFLTALYNSSTKPYSWDVISFGSDTSLEVAPGYDTVTGLGTPNAAAFVREAIKGSSSFRK